ncbi:MAG: alpha/beta hydrolase [Acidobacteriota bacterium]
MLLMIFFSNTKARRLVYLLALLIIFTSSRVSAFANNLDSQGQAKVFNVEIIGKGKPIILIPGLASAGEVWRPTAEHYRDGYQCHILTLAGFAGQPSVATTSFVETVYRAIATYIRTEKLDRPIIVGHSLGGLIALKLAAQEPDLMGQLVIVDSLPFFPAVIRPDATVETMKAQAEQMRTIITNQTPEQWKAFQQNSPVLKSMITDPKNVALAAKWGEESEPKTVAQAMYELYTTDIRDELSKIKSPTLVIGTWIAYKPYGTRESTEKIFVDQYAKLAGCKILMTDTARHFVMLDDPNWLFQQIDTFLKYRTK